MMLPSLLNANLRVWLGGIILAGLGCIVGCSSADRLLPVSGVVKSASGGPLGGEYGQITFSPVDPSVGTPASGPIDEQGAFSLTTGSSGLGARPGEYKVTLQVFKGYRDLKLVSPQEYADLSTTPLTATISPAATTFEFVVE